MSNSSKEALLRLINVVLSSYNDGIIDENVCLDKISSILKSVKIE